MAPAPARIRLRLKKADLNMEHVSPNFRSSFGSSYMNNRHARVDSIASSVTTPSIASPPEGATFGAVTVPTLAPGEQIVVINPHTRTYQACEECRRRKIKCDMGPVDNPHSPPCARCRRENKECNFNATRRKIPQKRKKEDLIDPMIQKRHRPMDLPTVDKDDENHTISILHHHKIETPLDSLQMLAVAAHGQFNMPAPSVARISVSSAQLQAWERLQFVRRGWFTAKEGVAYIEYFWNNLYPLTPITLPNYNRPDDQISLLENETFLLVVLLTISSRYMKLIGPGASSRQFAIHDKLWAHLRGMVERTVWAQEQFGGGVFGAGQSQDPRAAVGLRSLGSIEGLLLLTEWHPRALHFPPSNDDELMTPAPGTGERDAGDSDNESTLLLNGTGGQPGRDSWLEPCWRSDRMCWMLLSNAMSLAFEIGIFDDEEMPDDQVSYLQMRKAHLREVLPIYFVQLSGRLDLIGRLPRGYLDAIWPDAPTLSKPLPDFGLANGSAPPLAPKQDVLYFWKTLTVIMKSGNQKLFLNRHVTQNVIMDDHYITVLKDELEPLLSNWQSEFQECESAIHPLMRSILTIEFEYTRVYLHSLVLQAVIERFTNKSPLQDLQDNKNGIKGGMLRSYINNDDRMQIVQVIDGCRNVLKVVMDELLPGEFLKHCSVRTYFRIIAVAVILIKVRCSWLIGTRLTFRPLPLARLKTT